MLSSLSFHISSIKVTHMQNIQRLNKNTLLALLLSITALTLFSSFAFAEDKSTPKTETANEPKIVEYKDGDTVLEGLVSFPKHLTAKTPAVLVVHEWTGIGPYVKMRLKKLADLGYIAFAADIYGKGVRPATPEEAGKTAGIYKNNRALLRKRVTLAFQEMLKQKNVNPEKTVAIGYCFGGTSILELARTGANLKGFVSFHGGLNTPTPKDAANIKGEVLAFHGGDDPYVPLKEVEDFENEMRSGKVNWELVKFGGAVHSFTNPDAGNDNSKGAAYNKAADEKSWEGMKVFLKRIFS